MQKQGKTFVNPFQNPHIGRRTGVDVLAGKTIRTLSNGMPNFDDYWTDESSCADSIAEWSQVAGTAEKSPAKAATTLRHMSPFSASSRNSTITSCEPATRENLSVPAVSRRSAVALSPKKSASQFLSLNTAGDDVGTISRNETTRSRTAASPPTQNFQTRKRLTYSNDHDSTKRGEELHNSSSVHQLPAVQIHVATPGEGDHSEDVPDEQGRKTRSSTRIRLRSAKSPEKPPQDDGARKKMSHKKPNSDLPKPSTSPPWRTRSSDRLHVATSPEGAVAEPENQPKGKKEKKSTGKPTISSNVEEEVTNEIKNPQSESQHVPSSQLSQNVISQNTNTISPVVEKDVSSKVEVMADDEFDRESLEIVPPQRSMFMPKVSHHGDSIEKPAKSINKSPMGKEKSPKVPTVRKTTETTSVSAANTVIAQTEKTNRKSSLCKTIKTFIVEESSSEDNESDFINIAPKRANRKTKQTEQVSKTTTKNETTALTSSSSKLASAKKATKGASQSEDESDGENKSKKRQSKKKTNKPTKGQNLKRINRSVNQEPTSQARDKKIAKKPIEEQKVQEQVILEGTFRKSPSRSKVVEASDEIPHQDDDTHSEDEDIREKKSTTKIQKRNVSKRNGRNRRPVTKRTKVSRALTAPKATKKGKSTLAASNRTKSLRQTRDLKQNNSSREEAEDNEQPRRQSTRKRIKPVAWYDLEKPVYNSTTEENERDESLHELTSKRPTSEEGKSVSDHQNTSSKSRSSTPRNMKNDHFELSVKLSPKEKGQKKNQSVEKTTTKGSNTNKRLTLSNSPQSEDKSEVKIRGKKDQSKRKRNKSAHVAKDKNIEDDTDSSDEEHNTSGISKTKAKQSANNIRPSRKRTGQKKARKSPSIKKTSNEEVTFLDPDDDDTHFNDADANSNKLQPKGTNQRKEIINRRKSSIQTLVKQNESSGGVEADMTGNHVDIGNSPPRARQHSSSSDGEQSRRSSTRKRCAPVAWYNLEKPAYNSPRSSGREESFVELKSNEKQPKSSPENTPSADVSSPSSPSNRLDDDSLPIKKRKLRPPRISATPATPVDSKNVNKRKSVVIIQTPTEVPSMTHKQRRSILKNTTNKDSSHQRSELCSYMEEDSPQDMLHRLPRYSTAPPIHLNEVTCSQTPVARSASHVPRKQVKIVSPEPSEEGVRRSKRTKVKPLDWNRNERILYKRRQSGGFVIAGITSADDEGLPKKTKLEKLIKKKRRYARAPPTPRGLAAHRELKEDILAKNTTEVCVVNPATSEEVYVDCLRSRDTMHYLGPSGGEPYEDDPFIMCKSLVQLAFSAGKLVLRPLSKKTRQFVRKDTLVFYIIRGKLGVTIHQTTTILESGDFFFVPQGNVYSIENLRNEEAKLVFFQHKG